jgi:hypothetical protein
MHIHHVVSIDDRKLKFSNVGWPLVALQSSSVAAIMLKA